MQITVDHQNRLDKHLCKIAFVVEAKQLVYVDICDLTLSFAVIKDVTYYIV